MKIGWDVKLFSVLYFFFVINGVVVGREPVVDPTSGHKSTKGIAGKVKFFKVNSVKNIILFRKLHCLTVWER